MTSVSVISVNFNDFSSTMEFLTSVRMNAAGENIEVILIDNGSAEDHGDKFLEAFPGLTYIRSEKNLGFAAANNLGIRRARGEILIFLNNDTVVTPGLISALRGEIEGNPDIGIVSPLVLSSGPENTVQYAGFTRMNFLTGRNECVGSGNGNPDLFSTASGETGYCHGAAMAGRAAYIKQAGLIPENYFLYYEELEWCEKFRTIGKKIWFCGRVRIFHKKPPVKTALKEYYLARNRMLFVRRNSGWKSKIIFFPYFLLAAAPRMIMAHLINRRPDLAASVCRAIAWNLTHGCDSRTLKADEI